MAQVLYTSGAILAFIICNNIVMCPDASLPMCITAEFLQDQASEVFAIYGFVLEKEKDVANTSKAYSKAETLEIGEHIALATTYVIDAYDSLSTYMFKYNDSDVSLDAANSVIKYASYAKAHVDIACAIALKSRNTGVSGIIIGVLIPYAEMARKISQQIAQCVSKSLYMVGNHTTKSAYILAILHIGYMYKLNLKALLAGIELKF